MSAELGKARQLLSSVTQHLKQGKHLPAASALHEALGIMLRSQLMKSERDQFVGLIEQAVFTMAQDKALRSIYPLKIDYAPGQERELYAAMRTLLGELQANVADEAKQIIEDKEKKRAQGLAEGQQFLDGKQYDQAKKRFNSVIEEFHNDAGLKAEVGERFMNAGRYGEAVEYLGEALQDDPEAVHLYNRIGIALRKTGDFQTAENYYQRALEIESRDGHLYFNLGRLYVDWGRWDKVAEAAKRALAVAPDFEEARKMLAFALKKIG